MTLLRLTEGARRVMLEFGVDVEDMLTANLDCEGVECEVRNCRNKASEVWEINDDEVRNFCGNHQALVESFANADTGLTMVLDDGSLFQVGPGRVRDLP